MQSRLGIVVLHAIMEAGFAFMNHFPLFAVMLRFKDPARLPGGLHFEMKTEIDASGTQPYLCMSVRLMEVTWAVPADEAARRIIRSIWPASSFNSESRTRSNRSVTVRPC